MTSSQRRDTARLEQNAVLFVTRRVSKGFDATQSLADASGRELALSR